MLKQIRNIRKTIVPTQMPMLIPWMCVYTEYTESFSAIQHTPHVKSPLNLAPTSPVSQRKTLTRFTTPSQPWLLCDDDSDTELTAEDTAYTLLPRSTMFQRSGRISDVLPLSCIQDKSAISLPETKPGCE